jgi:hypothetical protein
MTPLLNGTSTATRWALASAALVLTAAGTVGFQRLGRVIKGTGGPSYDAFQRAGSAAAVRAARDAWGPTGLAAARKAWLLDLGYPVCYGVGGALLASLASTRATGQGREVLATTMAATSRLSLAAGAVDLVAENGGVGVGLWHRPNDAAARTAKVSGFIKWSLIGVVTLSLLFDRGVWIYDRFRR